MYRPKLRTEYSVIVIGGGHAGIEAAMATSRSGLSTLLATISINSIGRMSCNPAIGGSAKGQLVRELDALGGVMGKIADRTSIHFRMLNLSKGPAVWAQRTQNDRNWYAEEAQNILEDQPSLDIIETRISNIEIIGKAGQQGMPRVTGIVTNDGLKIRCKSLIICAGTFLHGVLHTGNNTVVGGRYGEVASGGITECLRSFGIISGRLKTGTPPRIDINSVNFNAIELQSGDINRIPFSFQHEQNVNKQIPMYLTYTNFQTHAILKKGFKDSPLFTGRIKGIGPRYCPSIEDKVERFKERERHQIFVEPEGYNTNVVYVNGFSTSLPSEIQEEGLRSIKGLEKCRVLRHGYAIEYDYFPPRQLKLSLESKIIEGLFFAGQVNGTSGYEEAAAQGLIAGINATLKLKGKEPLILNRSLAYIGVMIDDLVNKDTEEPYRMFTSRAEYRLLLRQDNADRRLMKIGHTLGLITGGAYNRLVQKEKLIEEGLKYFRSNNIKADQVNDYLIGRGEGVVTQNIRISKLIQRPEGKIQDLLKNSYLDQDQFIGQLKSLNDENLMNEILQQIEIEIKYDGYLKRQEEDVRSFEKQESSIIPEKFDFNKIKSLSVEGKEKLIKIKPRSVGQASRISGVTSADLSILLVHLKG